MAKLTLVKHDSQNEFYRRPLGAAEAFSTVRLRLKVGLEKYVAGEEPKVTLRFWQERVGEKLLTMEPDIVDGDKIYYTVTTEMPDRGCLLWYYFVIETDQGKWYYGNNAQRRGGMGLLSQEIPNMSYQITVFNKGAKTPDWFKHGVIYQIFPDRFYRAGKEMVAKKGAVYHACWDDKPFYYKDPDTKEIISYDFFGGDLAGIKAKLPYLKKLGISVIYLNPIFESASNHHYDTGDYHKVDPILGSNEEFQELCQEGAKLGIKFLLDGVFSHTGEDSIYFNKYGHYDGVGAFQSKQSPYYEWYDFQNYPNQYASWWGFSNLPNVHEENPAYMDFIINSEDSVLNYWMKQGISGWRLDVVDELPEKFSQAFYKKLKEINPEAVLIGEVWEDASNKSAYGVSREYLCGQELDSAMNYPFRDIVLDFLLGRDNAQGVYQRVNSLQENYPPENFYAMMNLLGSHDRERIMTLLGEAPSQENVPAIRQAEYKLDGPKLHLAIQRTKMAVLWQMTFPGVPSVYYGDEIGMQGYRDPYNRCPYDWANGDQELRLWHQKLIQIRNSSPALQTGKLLPIYNKDGVYGYARVIRDGKDVFGAEAQDGVYVVLLNRGQEEAKISLNLRDLAAGVMSDVMGNYPDIRLVRGKMDVTVPPYTGLLYQHKKLEPEQVAPRQSGVLLHPTSLPSSYGIGDLGPAAYEFVDFLVAAGQKIWQILPLNPVGPGNSPYASPSAFAGNSLLISLDMLHQQGLLDSSDLDDAAIKNIGKTAYSWAKMMKPSLFFKACMKFFDTASKDDLAEYDAFCEKNHYWLKDYALYQALHDWYHDKCWNKWDGEFRRRDDMALVVMEDELHYEIQEIMFEQFVFDQQWQKLKKYANERGVKIMGDMPIFVSLDSADAWAHQQLFKLDQNGQPYKVAGVPPDYFSKTGQLWGNPQYNWEVMRQDGYDWWIHRFRHLKEQVDIIRIDHFRGFEAFWEIDGDAKTAENGVWHPGPGKAFFDILRDNIGEMPMVAEDLGVITDAVEQLRQDCQFPGMKVLQFEMHFNEYNRINVVEPEDSLVYTGTHDNNTLTGWLQEDISRGEAEALANLLGMPNATPEELCLRLVERAYSSEARIAMVPVQDLLALDSSHRMNLPGTPDGNWSWRMTNNMLSEEKAQWLKALTVKYNR